jgi:hypothetical protein
MLQLEAYAMAELAYSIRSRCQDQHALILDKLRNAQQVCQIDDATRQIDEAMTAIRQTYDRVDADLERIIAALRTEETRAREHAEHQAEYRDPSQDVR